MLPLPVAFPFEGLYVAVRVVLDSAGMEKVVEVITFKRPVPSVPSDVALSSIKLPTTSENKRSSIVSITRAEIPAEISFDAVVHPLDGHRSTCPVSLLSADLCFLFVAIANLPLASHTT